MPRRRKRPFFPGKNRNDTFIIANQGIRGKNERFAVKTCCDYLLRVTRRHFVLDDNILEMFCWIADDPITEIGDFLLDRLPADLADSLAEDLHHDRGDVQSHGSSIIRILRKTRDRRLLLDFTEFLREYLELRRKSLANSRGADLEKSLGRLQAALRLSDLEAELCLFFFIVDNYQPPEHYFDDHLHTLRFEGKEWLGRIMDVPLSSLNTALARLRDHYGLLETRHSNRMSMTDEFQEILTNPDCDLLRQKNLRKISHRSVPPLEFHFFEPAELDHMVGLLDRKTDTPTHILLYGPPGTGKTSFARGLAGRLRDPVYEIVQGNDEESNSSKYRRVSLISAINTMNREEGSIFLMDEADNVLNTEHSWLFRGETQDKGWLNRLLEEPGLRVLWIVNHIRNIEDSVLRRFAYSRHFKPFSRGQRESLWDNILRRNRCKRFFTAADLRELAGDFSVSAGVIDLAVKKARESGRHTRSGMRAAVRRGIAAHQALAAGGTPPPVKTREPDYSLAGLNISGDMTDLLYQAEQFDRHLRNQADSAACGFTLLLHGPPGTGKSAFARYLARHLNRELLDRRLSDLLDPYVGMTEKYIRRAFDQAAAEGALLLLDEVDALLFPRNAAMRSWEVTQTNELLAAMERFRGLLICTTNRLTGLDTAAIRRFNHKVAFDFLTAQGNRIFYDKMLAPLVRKPLAEDEAAVLSHLRYLTPGDFKVVRDRFAFYDPGDLTSARLIEALRQEAALKQKQQGDNPIGF